MKKIFTILLTAVASFVLVSVANAQSIDETILDPDTNLSLEKRKLKFPNQKTNYTIDNSNGKKVAYRKSISEPFSDGSYYIKLESFATGSATKTVTSKPSDIILVLDLSSSMNSQTYTYKGRSMSRLDALRLVIEDFAKTVYDNNAEALSNDPDYAKDRIAIIGYNRNASMISTNGWVYIDDATNGVQKNASTGAYSGGLITKIQDMGYDSGTRPDHGFQMAIEELLTNGQSKRANANLTVLLFTDGYPTDQAGSGLGDAGQSAQSVDHFDYPFASKALYYGSQLKKNYGATLWSVGLITSVERPNNPTANNQWQYRNYCRVLQMMDWISSNYPDAAFDASSITSLAIENGTYKNRTSSTVFTGNNVVRPWRNDWAYSATGDAITLDDFVPGTTSSDGNKFVSDGFCQIVDDNTDFSSIFDQIAKQTAGTANPDLTSATSNVDIVSNSFILPDELLNATDIKDHIRVFTAKLNSITGANSGDQDQVSGTYNFATEILAPNSPDTYTTYDAQGNTTGINDVDNAISIELQGSNGIKVTNFDYAANFCGPVYKANSTTVDHYTGHKIIILIPIKMNPDAVGGPNVETNAKGSGLFLADGSNVIEFDSPSVSLPVNVYIEKSGLEGRESAKFKIERAEMPDMSTWTEAQIEDWDPNEDTSLDWQYVSSVFVTNSPTTEKSPIKTVGEVTTGGNPMVRVKGMPATLVTGWVNPNDPTDFIEGATKPESDIVHTQPIQVSLIYRISEEPWSWSYDPQTAPQFTVTTKIDNPFTFDNKKKNNIDVEVRHAESKVTNIFNSGTTKRFDDSKTNTGRESSGPDGLTTTTNP